MPVRLIISLAVLSLVVGCGGSSDSPASKPVVREDARTSVDDEQTPITTADGKLKLNKLVFTVPEGWQAKPVASGFVLAEFALPKAESDEADGRLTVSVAGGSIEANIDRWRDQFGGKPEQASEEQKEFNGLKVSLVDFAGEFSDQRGPFAPGAKRSGYRMLAAVIPVDGELHFVKAVGPRETMAAHAERFQQFVGSVAKHD